jgi:hypothetical protein
MGSATSPQDNKDDSLARVNALLASVSVPIQVRDANGSTAEGDFLKLVSEIRQRLKPTITNWRYVRDRGINAASAKSPKAVKVREISDADLENFMRQFGILTHFT